MSSFTFFQTPIGNLRLRANEKGLLAVDHVNQQSTQGPDWAQADQHPILKHAKNELELYFSGTLKTFKTPLQPKGTAFQQEVWQALRTIPFGETATYSDIAHLINNPKAVRAVGAANGKNPLSIFIPCHRIIGKSGKLVGYAGGMDAKQILLNLEFGLKN